MRRELDDDPGASSRREQAARERAAAERERRVDAALAALADVERRKKPRAKKDGESDEEHARRSEPRASTTDPEARVMKMADGGFRPAFNVQFAADTATQVVVGVSVSNAGGDMSQLTPMLAQLERRHGRLPRDYLVDGGFANRDAITQAEARQVTVYAPPAQQRRGARPSHAPRHGDTPAVRAWRERMSTAEAQQVYRQRAATAECVNAIVRQRGLQQFNVRGLGKALAVALWHALAHNLMRALALRAPQPA